MSDYNTEKENYKSGVERDKIKTKMTWKKNCKDRHKKKEETMKDKKNDKGTTKMCEKDEKMKKYVKKKRGETRRSVEHWTHALTVLG